jgi:hypothetical protein
VAQILGALHCVDGRKENSQQENNNNNKTIIIFMNELTNVIFGPKQTTIRFWFFFYR